MKLDNVYYSIELKKIAKALFNNNICSNNTEDINSRTLFLITPQDYLKVPEESKRNVIFMREHEVTPDLILKAITEGHEDFIPSEIRKNLTASFLNPLTKSIRFKMNSTILKKDIPVTAKYMFTCMTAVLNTLKHCGYINTNERTIPVYFVSKFMKRFYKGKFNVANVNFLISELIEHKLATLENEVLTLIPQIDLEGFVQYIDLKRNEPFTIKDFIKGAIELLYSCPTILKPDTKDTVLTTFQSTVGRYLGISGNAVGYHTRGRQKVIKFRAISKAEYESTIEARKQFNQKRKANTLENEKEPPYVFTMYSNITNIFADANGEIAKTHTFYYKVIGSKLITNKKVHYYNRTKDVTLAYMDSIETFNDNFVNVLSNSLALSGIDASCDEPKKIPTQYLDVHFVYTDYETVYNSFQQLSAILGFTSTLMNFNVSFRNLKTGLVQSNIKSIRRYLNKVYGDVVSQMISEGQDQCIIDLLINSKLQFDYYMNKTTALQGDPRSILKLLNHLASNHSFDVVFNKMSTNDKLRYITTHSQQVISLLDVDSESPCTPLVEPVSTKDFEETFEVIESYGLKVMSISKSNIKFISNKKVLEQCIFGIKSIFKDLKNLKNKKRSRRDTQLGRSEAESEASLAVGVALATSYEISDYDNLMNNNDLSFNLQLNSKSVVLSDSQLENIKDITKSQMTIKNQQKDSFSSENDTFNDFTVEIEDFSNF